MNHDDDLRQLVRRAYADVTVTPEQRQVLFAQLAASRPWWRRAAPAGASLLAAAAVASAILLAIGVQRHAPSPGPTTAPHHLAPIPWIPTPGHTLQGLEGQSSPRACGGADLRISSPSGVALFQGNRVESMRLTNVSAASCVSAPPTVIVRLASGGTLLASATGSAFADVKVDLAPGQSANLAIGSPSTCSSYNPAAPRLGTPVSATLPDGASLSVAGAPPFDIQCGPPRMVLFFANEPTSPPTSGEPALQVTLRGPASAIRGKTYEYTVTLTSPTATTVSLLPCPSYSEGLTGDHGVLNTETYLLNCDTVTSLAPGASATFQMQYQVPPSLPQGSTKFWWVMQIPNGPAGGTSLQLSSGS